MVVLILHAREIQIMWSQILRNRVNQSVAIHHGKASEMLAYRVREHNQTSQNIKKKRKKEGKKRKTLCGHKLRDRDTHCKYSKNDWTMQCAQRNEHAGEKTEEVCKPANQTDYTRKLLYHSFAVKRKEKKKYE